MQGFWNLRPSSTFIRSEVTLEICGLRKPKTKDTALHYSSSCFYNSFQHVFKYKEGMKKKTKTKTEGRTHDKPDNNVCKNNVKTM